MNVVNCTPESDTFDYFPFLHFHNDQFVFFSTAGEERSSADDTKREGMLELEK